MRRALSLTAALLVLAGSTAAAVELGPILVGIHFIPAVEAGEEGRLWDVSISFGVGISLDDENYFEVHALTDSHITSLGLTARYQGRVNDRLSGGGGITVLWPFDENERLLRPLVEAFARLETWAQIGPIFEGELGVSFPLLTVVHRISGWKIIPLADLPSVSVAGAFDFANDEASFQAQLTLQPVITDTTVLERPIGRVAENLIILPSVSGFLRYMP